MKRVFDYESLGNDKYKMARAKSVIESIDGSWCKVAGIEVSSGDGEILLEVNCDSASIDNGILVVLGRFGAKTIGVHLGAEAESVTVYPVKCDYGIRFKTQHLMEDFFEGCD